MDKQLCEARNVLYFPGIFRDVHCSCTFAAHQQAGDAAAIGGILLGANKSAHILTFRASARRIVNMSAPAVAGVATRSE